MQDGHTRKLDRGAAEQALFLSKNRVVLVALDGPAAGSEYALTSERATLGRGPDVTFAFDDDAMSKQHAAFELATNGFRLVDLDSTNGTTVNGSPVSSADLKHGDKIALGRHTLQFVVEPRSSVRSWDLSD